MEEVLLSGGVVFKERGRKVSWLIFRPGKDEEWQLLKVLVRSEESSVRAIIRTISTLGLRSSVIEEVGRVSTTTTRNGSPLNRRIIYYLIQQKGKDGEVTASYAKIEWSKYPVAKSKLTTLAEKRILFQARKILAEWRKQQAKGIILP